MSEAPMSHPHGPRAYEIRVRGRLAPHWAASFDGLTLAHRDDGTSVVHGVFADQAALHGVLAQLRDLALPLISVSPSDAADHRTPRQRQQPTDPRSRP